MANRVEALHTSYNNVIAYQQNVLDILSLLDRQLVPLRFSLDYCDLTTPNPKKPLAGPIEPWLPLSEMELGWKHGPKEDNPDGATYVAAVQFAPNSAKSRKVFEIGFLVVRPKGRFAKPAWALGWRDCVAKHFSEPSERFREESFKISSSRGFVRWWKLSVTEIDSRRDLSEYLDEVVKAARDAARGVSRKA